jgi:hypothetical protein
LFLKTYPNNIFTKEKYRKEVPSIKPVDFIKKARLNYAAKLLVKGISRFRQEPPKRVF